MGRSNLAVQGEMEKWIKCCWDSTTQLKRAGRNIPDTLLKHISPLSWEHINLTGIYTWDAEHQMSNGFRPLRLPVGLRRVA